MRRAAKVDRTHGAIVAAIEQCGGSVLSLAQLGNGVPDLLVWHPRQKQLMLIEVKDGAQPPSKRALTPQQGVFHANWPSRIYVVGSVGQAIQLMGEK